MILEIPNIISTIAMSLKCLEKDGILLLSGFYEDDLPIIDKEASKNNLKLHKTKTRNQWLSGHYKKQ